MSEPNLLQREIKQGRPFRSRAQEAAIAILRTADVLRREFAELTDPYGITPQQYNVLRILRGSHPDPLPVLEVADRLIERTPGVTRLLDRLEQKNLVHRQRCETDRRQVHCWITPSGLELLAALDALVDDADARLTGVLDEKELRQLIRSLERIRSAG